MHEMSMMNSLMQQIISLASEEKARRIVGVKVTLGALSHISPEHFTEHFVEAAAGGIAEGAKLTIETSTDLAEPWAQDAIIDSVEIES